MGIQVLSYTMRCTLGSLVRSRSTGARTFVSTTRVCYSEDKKQSSGSTTGLKSTESGAESVEVPDVILKEVPDAKYHWEYQQSSEEAQVYDRKPVKVKCTEGKVYMWCACGHSHRQPFCDGTHRLPILKNIGRAQRRLRRGWFKPEMNPNY